MSLHRAFSGGRLLLGLLMAVAVSTAAMAGPENSLVQVYGYRWSRVCGTASGFVVDQGRILTAGHVAKMGSSLKVRDANGRMWPARVVACGVPDWAMLECDGLPEKPLKICCMSSQSGDPVATWGDFRGTEGRVVQNFGRVAPCSYQGDYLFTTARVRPGFSGGPVVDSRGQAVGIVSMQTPGGSCLFVPLWKIYRPPRSK